MRLPDEDHLSRVRRVCLALPAVTEKLSHGEPTFFAGKRVFAMFANNHHGDGHIGVWLPVPPGHADRLIAQHPDLYFRPPYVGVKGWVGIELAAIDNDLLSAHLLDAWKLIAPARAVKDYKPTTT